MNKLAIVLIVIGLSIVITVLLIPGNQLIVSAIGGWLVGIGIGILCLPFLFRMLDKYL